MKNYEFKYGSGKVNIELDETSVLAELHGHEVPPIQDISEALKRSLQEPIGMPPLQDWIQPGDQITLIISDGSRYWMRQDLVIPHVIAELNKLGIPDENIVILVATGTHVGADEKELKMLVSEEVYKRVKVVNHDCTQSDLMYVGTTSRGTEVELNPLAFDRKVIALGAATHHVMAGYGGGRKSILPGISSMKTICQNHAWSLDPSAPRSNPSIGNGVLEKNPLNEDMIEAARMVKDLYCITLVMNAEMKLCRIFSGDIVESWMEACKAVNDCYAVDVPCKADVVVTSGGGYPKDMSLYQGTKTIDNVESALKPGGTLVLLLECREGGGHAEYFDWIEPLKKGTLDEELRKHFTVPGYIFYLNCEQARRYHILMLTSVAPQVVAPMGIEAVNTVEELQKRLQFTGKSVYVIENGSTVIPRVKEADA